MQIDLIDTEKFISVNNLKAISNPLLFSYGGVISSDGLLSTDIFGTTSKERRETYAYINLNGYFLTPFIYKLLKRMNRNFESIVHGSKKFVIKNGELILDDENGNTGIKFLYDNWDKINFTKNNSQMRNERIDVLKSYKKNVIFTKYWIVIPPFYRDVNMQSSEQGKLSHNPLNDKYTKLIRLCAMIDNSNNFDVVLNSTKATIQTTLVEIYDMLKGKLEKKQGLIRKNLLAKSVDYGSRLVISTPVFNQNRYDDMDIDLYHTGIPLSHCCSLYTPFIVAWVRQYFIRELERSGKKYPVKNKNDEIEFVELEEPELYFNDDYIKKEIDQFVHAYSERFTPIQLPTVDKSRKLYFSFVGREYSVGKTEDESPIINRPATWCDILYQAAVDVTSDKMIYVTRYPVGDYFGVYTSGVFVKSTTETMPVYINGRVYKRYPKIDLTKSKDEVAISFSDTASIPNLYLFGIEGDFDGDQVSVKAVYSQEANEEARRLMYAKTNILNQNGNNMRTTEKEGILSLYCMTKFDN